MSATLIALALVACTDSHGRVPNVDGNAPIISLTVDEWAQFCIWREGLREGEQLTYDCDEDGNPLVGECPRTDCYTWRRADCISGIWSLDDFYPSTRVTCTATVEQFAACWESRTSVACYRTLPVTPECAAFEAACPPSMPPDAGADAE